MIIASVGERGRREEKSDSRRKTGNNRKRIERIERGDNRQQEEEGEQKGS